MLEKAQKPGGKKEKNQRGQKIKTKIKNKYQKAAGRPSPNSARAKPKKSKRTDGTCIGPKTG